MTDYDANRVQEIWESIIELDLDIKDPYYAQNNDEYHDIMNNATKTINRKKKASRIFETTSAFIVEFFGFMIMPLKYEMCMFVV